MDENQIAKEREEGFQIIQAIMRRYDDLHLSRKAQGLQDDSRLE